MSSSFEEWWAEHQNDEGVREQLEARTLRARWSRELQEDLSLIHGINAEETLSEILAEEVGNELGLDPVLIPAVRRVMPTLMAGEIAEVQPVNGISGMTFALRYRPEDGYSEITAMNTAKIAEVMKRDHFVENEELFEI